MRCAIGAQECGLQRRGRQDVSSSPVGQRIRPFVGSHGSSCYMLKVVGQGVLRMVPTLLGIVLLVMLILELMPGDPARIMAGENAPPETVAAIRADMRLDQPPWVRFGDYAKGLLHGNLGESPIGHVSVWDRITSTIPVTLSLGVVALVLAMLIGVSAGALAALKRGSWVDRAVTAAAAVVQAVPPFVIGLALVLPLAVDRSWFPATGYSDFTENPFRWFQFLVLPAFTLALGSAAELARQTRGALVDTLEQDFIRACRAKGLSEALVIGKHAAKSAATPVVTVLGLQVGRILSGAVVAELIFGLPGFGSLALNAVLSRDLVLIQGIVLVCAVGVLLSNLIVDVTTEYLNPRSRV